VGVVLLGRRLGDVEPAFGVDPDFEHAQRPDFLRDFFRPDGKAAAQEVVFHPAAVEVMDVHAGLELVDGDELDHIGTGTDAVIVREYPIW